MLILATEIAQIDWGTVIVQSLITLGVVFGGAGYWEYRRAKMQKKWDDESKKNGVENKIDTVAQGLVALTKTVDSMSDDLLQIKSDIELLEKANQVTVEYRETRDKRDKEALKAQEAVIDSLKGLLRERLLDNYYKCIEKGYYTMEERETYHALFECYTREPFRGNGVMHDLQPILVQLPRTAEEAATSKKKAK
ncbi:MAG: hypothetical protein J5725_06370 [Bacteroidales bacterium]|nr:hypothetical protein [Bacteroidales bacterium]